MRCPCQYNGKAHSDSDHVPFMLIVKLYREQGVNKVVSERYSKNAYQQQLDQMEQVCVDDSVWIQ